MGIQTRSAIRSLLIYPIVYFLQLTIAKISTLFRQKAITYRSDRLSGDVMVAVPVAWQVVGYSIFAGLVTALDCGVYCGFWPLSEVRLVENHRLMLRNRKPSLRAAVC